MTSGGERAGTAASRWGLVALEAVIMANAVYGGIGLIRDGIGIPLDWLQPTVFDTWQWPGVFLIIVIALPMAVAAVLEVVRAWWAFAASMVAGAGQVGWILVQLAVLRRYFFLQPVLLAAGLLVAALAVASHRGERLIPSPRRQRVALQ